MRGTNRLSKRRHNEELECRDEKDFCSWICGVDFCWLLDDDCGTEAKPASNAVMALDRAGSSGRA